MDPSASMCSDPCDCTCVRWWMSRAPAHNAIMCLLPFLNFRGSQHACSVAGVAGPDVCHHALLLKSRCFPSYCDWNLYVCQHIVVKSLDVCHHALWLKSALSSWIVLEVSSQTLKLTLLSFEFFSNRDKGTCPHANMCLLPSLHWSSLLDLMFVIMQDDWSLEPEFGVNTRVILYFPPIVQDFLFVISRLSDLGVNIQIIWVSPWLFGFLSIAQWFPDLAVITRIIWFSQKSFKPFFSSFKISRPWR